MPEALEELPVTSETKSLYAHVKKEWEATEAAKKRGIISPVNALRQLADLERTVATFILSRPKLSLTTAEVFRAEILLYAFKTDRKLKQLTTNDSIRIISKTGTEDPPEAGSTSHAPDGLNLPEEAEI